MSYILKIPKFISYSGSMSYDFTPFLSIIYVYKKMCIYNPLINRHKKTH